MHKFIVILILFLSSCSYSELVKVSYFKFDNELTKKSKQFELKSFFFKNGFTNYSIYSRNGYNYFMIAQNDDIFSIYIPNKNKTKNISFTWLPLVFWIPIPPIIPNFSNSIKDDMYYNEDLVILVTYYGNNKINIDKNKIYLIKDNNRIYCNYFKMSDNHIMIRIPIYIDKIDNSTIVIDGINVIKDNNILEKVDIPNSVIKYTNGYIYNYGSIL